MVRDAINVTGKKVDFGTSVSIHPLPSFKQDRYMARVSDTIEAMAISAAAPYDAPVATPRHIITRKVKRSGPCLEGCTVTSFWANGVEVWRKVPAACGTYPAGGTLCEAHYKQSLAALRRARSGAIIANGTRKRGRHAAMAPLVAGDLDAVDAPT